MTDAERIAALEAQLAATKKAAVHMMVGMAQGVAQTPDGLRYLAVGFTDAAHDTDPIIAGLAQKVAEALRLQWMSEVCPKVLAALEADASDGADGATVPDEETGNSK